MKTFSIYLTIIVLTIFSLSSCSKKNKRQEVAVTPKTIEITGAFSPYYEIVQSSYKLIKPEDQTSFQLKLQVKRTDKPFSLNYDAVDMGKRGFISIFCDLYDETNVPAIIADAWGGRLMMNDAGASNIMDLKLGETGWIEIDFGYNFTAEEILKAKTFAIRTEVDQNSIDQMNSETSSTQSTVSESETSDSQDWDKVLADYEAYTDQYINLIKKAKDGDASAMTEYVEMLEKAQGFQESLLNANNMMSTDQLQKFTRIQQKLLNAASSI